MKPPKSIKGLLSMLIAIAHEGNCPRVGDSKVSDRERRETGAMIADIQNNLGEMRDTLEKFGLEYNG